MPGIQPQTLSDEELERYAYLQAGALPPEWAEHLRKILTQPTAPHTDDPRQLNLFDLQ